MELYTAVAYRSCKQLTLSYSTSFGVSSRLLGNDIKPHIYAIYALVRIADEIVDTYMGEDALEVLNDLEAQVYRSIETGYSSNVIVHAYADTARRFGIDRTLIAPFFESMRMDVQPQRYTVKNYEQYIHGSAEVVGLMCLRVFVNGNNQQYDALAPGAAALGSAYQKVNFLRDLAADYNNLGRLYFPGLSFESFDEAAKRQIISDINEDFAAALPALRQLPKSSKRATQLSYGYYLELLHKLERTPPEIIKQARIRVTTPKKLYVLCKTTVTGAPHI